MKKLGNLLRQIGPLGLGFLVLLVAAAGTVWLSIRQENASSWIRHTLEVESNINALQTLITDAESSQRGYLITRREMYLDPYHAANAKIGAAIDALARQTADNPNQKANIAELLPLLSEKQAQWSRLIELRDANLGIDSLGEFNRDTNFRLMARMRALMDRMRTEERRLLELRSSRGAITGLAARVLLVASVIWVAVLGFFTLRDSGRRIASLEDLTSRLQIEATERAAAQNQVAHLTKMEAVGQLTGGIAHDFNNMLAIIIGALGVVRRRLKGTEDAQIPKFLDAAEEGARRGAELTSRLLAFSRKLPLAPKVLDVNKLVVNTSELLRRTLGEAITIETVLSGGLWRTNADPTQVESSIVNLAVNARDAMPSGGKLTIETANCDLDERYARAHAEVTAGQYVMISITDTGHGMPADVIARAFDPFFTTKDVGKGTGLGLSQVFGFVKQSGGHIKIYSEMGQGTTVKLYLPRHAGEGAETADAPASVARPGSPGEVVLVVEDDPGVRIVSVNSLRELGYTVIHAGGAEEALKALEQAQDVTLLFTDIVMPKTNGRQLAEQAAARWPSLKVLYTTGYTRNAVVHNGILDPGTAFLPKPYTLEELSAKIRDVLDN